MTQETFKIIRNHMITCMGDSAHDCLHIYRVLHQALRIAEHYTLDRDVLIASCLLHDIGRKAFTEAFYAELLDEIQMDNLQNYP